MAENLNEGLRQYAVFLEEKLNAEERALDEVERIKRKQKTYNVTSEEIATEQNISLYKTVRDKLYELIPETILISEVWRGRVPVRFAVVLRKLGIKTVGDLAAKTEEELKATRKFGDTSLQELRDGLLKPFGFDYRKQQGEK